MFVWTLNNKQFFFSINIIDKISINLQNIFCQYIFLIRDSDDRIFQYILEIWYFCEVNTGIKSYRISSMRMLITLV